jgi:collagenase-like PrtC family protease
MNYIQWLDDIEVDSVTVSLPYLIELIKQQFQRLKVQVSVICHVNNINLINFYESLGADVIVLDYMINRDFHLIRHIRDNTNCELEILANESCLFQCPFRSFHFNFMGHESQVMFHRNIESNYYLLKCSRIKLLNPKEFMMARWIRPEDIHEYERLGINRLKLSGRCASTSWLANVLKAYSQRKYEGDLINLLTGMRIIQARSNSNHSIMIDNSNLDGFLEYFKKGFCTSNCRTCEYCTQWAEKAVKVDRNNVNRILNEIDQQLHHNLSLKKIRP